MLQYICPNWTIICLLQIGECSRNLNRLLFLFQFEYSFWDVHFQALPYIASDMHFFPFFCDKYSIWFIFWYCKIQLHIIQKLNCCEQTLDFFFHILTSQNLMVKNNKRKYRLLSLMEFEIFMFKYWTLMCS